MKDLQCEMCKGNFSSSMRCCPLCGYQNASFSALSDPLKEYREAMKAISDPLSEYREAIAAISDPLRRYRETMKAISEPFSGYREAVAAILDPLKEYRESMKAISEPLSGYRDMSDPLRDYREAMKAVSDPFRDYREALLSIKDPLDFLRAQALGVENDLEIHPDGVVSLNEKEITSAELQEISNRIFNRASHANNESIEESLNNLISEVQKLNDPLLIKIIYFFIFPLIIGAILSILNPITDHYVNRYLDVDKRALTKELNRSIVESVDDRTVLKEFRFVTADVLNVRSSPSQSSEPIGLLYFSSVVLIIQREKSWTLIEWEDTESEARIQGWVFSRYLRKFR